LADFDVKIEPIRQGGPKRGLVTGFRLSWWRKDILALQEAYKEINRSKVGRIERLTGKTENFSGVNGEITEVLRKLHSETFSSNPQLPADK
jgi:hypothetical protein